jgi:hypothetical protein
MDKDESLSKFILFLKNEPLIEANESLKGINENLLLPEKRAIFYGTGLCTPTSISIGLPFDVLGMIFVAERIRKTFKFDKVIHHIADTHARSNNLFSAEEIEKLAQIIKADLVKVFRNFGFKNFQVTLASDFDKTSDYQDLLGQLPNMEHEYVRREVADIRWYSLKHGVNLKLGWIINTGLDLQQGNDEILFDDNFNKLFPNQMSFLYLKPGRTFNRARQRVSPYIFLKGEDRIMLRKDEDVKEKIRQAEKEWGDKFFGGARKHLENIVHAYEKLFGNLTSMPLEEKIQYILDRAVAD